MSRVVTDPLREGYAQIEKQRGRASVEELLAIADQVAIYLKRPYTNHGELPVDGACSIGSGLFKCPAGQLQQFPGCILMKLTPYCLR